MRRVAMRLVMDPDAEFVLGGQGEFRGDGDIARLHVFVGVLQDADLPAAFGRHDLGLAAPRQFQPFAERSAVQGFQFGIERAARFIDDARQDSAQALHVAGMQVDVEDGRRQRRVVQRLETFAHVADDLQNDVSRGGGIGWGGTVHRGTNFDFNSLRGATRLGRVDGAESDVSSIGRDPVFTIMESKKGRNRTVYRLALGILIVVICAANVLWIRINVAPPRMYDDAVYLTDSVKLFQTIQERGLAPFLRECAEATKGHPPMIKILPVPFYFLFGPGTASALYAYTLLIAIFCIYLFLLARELFHSEEIAIFAVIICTAFPLTYGMWRNVMAEFGTTLAVTACLYHLVRSDGFRIRKHVLLAGLFFGWGMLWKISFPIFLIGPMMYVVICRARNRIGNLGLFGATVLLVAGPFYHNRRPGSDTVCQACGRHESIHRNVEFGPRSFPEDRNALLVEHGQLWHLSLRVWSISSAACYLLQRLQGRCLS